MCELENRKADGPQMCGAGLRRARIVRARAPQGRLAWWRWYCKTAKTSRAQGCIAAKVEKGWNGGRVRRQGGKWDGKGGKGKGGKAKKASSVTQMPKATKVRRQGWQDGNGKGGRFARERRRATALVQQQPEALKTCGS